LQLIENKALYERNICVVLINKICPEVFIDLDLLMVQLSPISSEDINIIN